MNPTGAKLAGGGATALIIYLWNDLFAQPRGIAPMGPEAATGLTLLLVAIADAVLPLIPWLKAKPAAAAGEASAGPATGASSTGGAP